MDEREQDVIVSSLCALCGRDIPKDEDEPLIVLTRDGGGPFDGERVPAKGVICGVCMYDTMRDNEGTKFSMQVWGWNPKTLRYESLT